MTIAEPSEGQRQLAETDARMAADTRAMRLSGMLARIANDMNNVAHLAQFGYLDDGHREWLRRIKARADEMLNADPVR